MTRRTSIEAYHTIQEKGLLGQRQWEVYDVVYHNGPILANEAFRIIASQRGKNFSYDSNTRARFTELREMGVLVEVGTRMDPITRMNGILWDVTEGLPHEVPQKKGGGAMHLVQELMTRIDQLEATVNQLKENIGFEKSGQRVMFSGGSSYAKRH